MKFYSRIGASAVLSLAVLTLPAQSAFADPIGIYSSRADWNAAAPGAAVITFEGATEGTSTHYGSTPTVFNRVTFTAGGQLFTVAAALDYDSPHHRSTYLEWQNPPVLNVSLSGGVHAVAFDYGTFYGESDTLELLLPWGEAIELQTATGADRFLGLVFSGPITGFVLRDLTGAFPTLDNFSFVSTAPIPKPGSLLLVGTGLMWSVKRLRRSRLNRLN